jgi:uncharacterized protein (DUF342 family)
MDEQITKHIAVVVSEDEMSADLFLGMVDDPDVYNVDDIIEYLKDVEHIVAGVKPSVIMEMINQRTYGKMVTVATGAPGVDGRDGFYNFQFDTSPSKKPKVLPDGTVDYHNLSLVQSVEIGDLLATYVPKCEGRDGYTVKGKVLPAKRCKDIPPLRGKGFTISSDGKKYYAAVDGKVELSMGQLNVLQFHTINGDVDLSVGNIDFKGDLEILGSIKEGFTVKATGNITVNKLIEAANVEAGKDILVRGGILGGGIGNLIDRFFRPAGVVDFIDCYFFGIFGMERWPTFNIADSAVVICGAIFVVSFIVSLVKDLKKSKAKKEDVNE